MLSDQPGPQQYLKAILIEKIGLSETSADLLLREFGELDVQRHAMYCLWMMNQGKVHVPPAWLTASLKGNWDAPHRIPSDWLPIVLHFRVDEITFVEFQRMLRQSS